MRKSILFIWHIPRNTAIFTIQHIYQLTLSPDHSLLGNFLKPYLYPKGFCRFTPTCSVYGIKALKKYGVIIGSLKAIWRVIRCNPWSKAGIDDIEIEYRCNCKGCKNSKINNQI